MNIFKHQFVFYSLLGSCLLFFIFFARSEVLAAELFLKADSQNIKAGDEFKVDVFLDAEESINAVEGKILIPANASAIKEIKEGNSIISFWIEPPRVDKNNNIIIFSGITPGGFQGKGGLIFSIILKAQVEGSFTMDLQDSKALLNDGTGAGAVLSIKPLALNISKAEGQKAAIPEERDMESPEAFKPEIGRDPDVFNNQWFVAFSTKDKNSGISKYQIKETRFKTFVFLSFWQDAVSPYLLQDQTRKSNI